jgi:putative transposase
MPRPKREDFPGAFHHVMNRGARRQPIFKVPDDCQAFLDVLADVVARSDVEVHAYSLMPNHYHLLVRSMRGNLSEAMQQLDGSYTLRMNRRHRWDGPLFRGRFKSQILADPDYRRMALAYIHLNPVRARLVPRLSSDAWTSHRAYVNLNRAPRWLTTSHFLKDLGGVKGVGRFVQSVHEGATQYPEELDSETGLFRTKTIRQAGWGGKGRKPGEERDRLRAAAGEEALARVRRITGATEAMLLERKYGPAANPARRFAIWALYRRGVKQREIAERMRTTYYQVSRLLSRLRNEKAREPLRRWMQDWLESE